MELSEGNYWAVRKEAGKGESKTGTPYAYLEFDVTHRAQNGEWVGLENPRRRTVYLYLSDAASKYSLDKLDRLGFEGDFGDMRFTSRGDACELVCRHENYNDKLHEKWDIGGRGETTHKDVDADVVRRLNALWKQRPKSPESSAHSAPEIPSAASKTPPDDSIPF